MKRLVVFLPPGGAPQGYLEAAVSRAVEIFAEVHAVYVVDALWGRYSSADWLSTGPSRAEFDEYMKATLLAEGSGMAEALASLADKAGVLSSYETGEGDPAEILAGIARGQAAVEVIMPSGRPELDAALGGVGCRVFRYTG